MSKRGMSAVIVTLLLVMLSIVLIGIVYAVISNIVKSGTQQTTFQFGTLFIDLQMSNVRVDPATGNVLVSVKRIPGGDSSTNLSGVAFVVSDGTNTQAIKKQGTIDPLSTKTFTLTQSDLSGISVIKSISIAPLIQSGNSQQAGSLADNVNLTTKQVLEELGAVSWWSMNGNGNDQIGGNNGQLVNGVDCNVKGKYEEACQFDGSDYIAVPHSSDFDLDQLTIAMWIKTPSSMSIIYRNLLSKQGATRDYNFYTHSSDNSKVTELHFSSAVFGSFIATLPTPYQPNTWHYVAVTVDKTGLEKLYSDGENFAQNQGTAGNANSNFPIWIGRADNYWNGLSDEVVIFNRALTADQIKMLYNLDFNS